MRTERTASQPGDESQERMVRMGMLQVDFGSRLAKRIDNSKTFRLRKNEITLLRIIDGEDWISTRNLAYQYKITKLLNKAMFLVTSQNVQSGNALKILDKQVFSFRGDDMSLEKSINTVRVSMWGLRKKIGSDLIHSHAGFGYRLKRE